ncbi:hypothetical protein A6J71_00065 [Enterobacter cancerogenus]|uniref:hypothetical protein n=1 Tax=Enterobacter cancerogenus TaxID=69218 RepID=UPI000C9AD20B|nr:hypothetical protein [Enterobacter cancerogenus]PNF13471.1 hypothetical protein A6J71_00065 [Enterobacter cancerogenus]
MMRLKYIMLVLLFIIGTFIAWKKFDNNSVSFTCVGGFSSQVIHDNLVIKNISDISINFFRDQKIFIAIDGSVTQNDKRYHLSRELWFSWQPVDLPKGIIRVKLIEVRKTGADTVVDDKVNHYILGAEPAGRIFRIWRLKDNILLIGNAFSPVMSCTVLT